MRLTLFLFAGITVGAAFSTIATWRDIAVATAAVGIGYAAAFFDQRKAQR